MPYRFEWAPDEKRRDFGIAVNDTVLRALENGDTMDDAYKKADENGEALQLVAVVVKTHADLVQRKKLCEVMVPIVSSANIDMREAIVAIGEATTLFDALNIVCAWLKIVLQQKDALDRECSHSLARVKELEQQMHDVSRVSYEDAVGKDEAIHGERAKAESLSKQLAEQRERADALAAEATPMRATVVDLRARLEKAVSERDLAFASFRNGNANPSPQQSARTEELEARLRQTTEEVRHLEKRVHAAEEAARETNMQLVRINGELVSGNLQRHAAPTLDGAKINVSLQQPKRRAPSPLKTKRMEHRSGGGHHTNHGRCTCGWCA